MDDRLRSRARAAAGSLRKVLGDEGANVFTAEMLDRAAQNRRELDHLAEDDDFVLFLEPPSLDDRIVNQYALFSLMSSAEASLDEWGEQHRGPRPQARRPGGAEVGGARQARPGEHHGAGPVPGPGRPERMAAALLPPAQRLSSLQAHPHPWVGFGPPRTQRRGYRCARAVSVTRCRRSVTIAPHASVLRGRAGRASLRLDASAGEPSPAGRGRRAGRGSPRTRGAHACRSP